MTSHTTSDRRGRLLLLGTLAVLAVLIAATAWRVSAPDRSPSSELGCHDERPPKLASRPPPGGGARQLALAGDTSCSTMRDGAVWCWGAPAPGGVVNANVAMGMIQLLPAAERRGFVLGKAGRCDIAAEGPAHCSTSTGEPFTIAAPKKIAIGDDHACAISGEGSLRCWGDNAFGQLFEATSGPTSVRDARQIVTNVRDVAVGPGFTCVVRGHGAIECRGVGQGAATRLALSRMSGAKAVATGESHACALVEGDRVVCWGNNALGQLGDGTTIDRETPVEARLPARASQIVASGKRSCAIVDVGAPYCWGEDLIGRSSPTPIAVRAYAAGQETRPIADADAVALGVSHACALRRNGAVACWGDNTQGQVSPKLDLQPSGGQSSHSCERVMWSEPSGSESAVDVFWGRP